MPQLIAKSIFLGFSGCIRMGFVLIRLAERLLPQRLLSFLLWPLAGALSLIEIGKKQRAFAAWRRLAEFEATPSRTRLWFWHSVGADHARLVYLFPDRLGQPRWLRRCRLTASDELDRVRSTKRRIVFVSLHFGPFETLVYWLRAQSLPVTALVGRPAPRQTLKQHQYALSPPSGLPVVLPVTELGALREAISRVQHLLVFMDVERGRQVEVRFDQLICRLATGPIRLAAMANAELIPCLTTVSPGWNFTLHFGRPVPRNYFVPTPDIELVTGHLLEEFFPIVRQHPAQCGHRLLSCLRGVERVPEPGLHA